MGYTSNTKEFIARAILIHGDKYNYSKVNYVKRNTIVIITCKIHGDFPQTPNDHLQGCGCVKCKGTRKSTTNQFIIDAKQIHSNLYEYAHSNYTGVHEDIIITCKIHGDFKQTPNNHIHARAGCNQCGILSSRAAKVSTTADFIRKAESIYGIKYDYSKVCYIDNNTKVIIKCKMHGDFKQTPAGHFNGDGCSLCKPQGFSQLCINWLELIMRDEKIFIQHAKNVGEYRIPSTRYRADGYCELTNTIYEFYGDRWHGNLNIFESHICCSHYTELTAGELYQKTISREQEIKDLGYNLIVIWESDYNILINI
jgi:hypothetical protein